MISVDEAEKIVLQHAKVCASTEVPIREAYGRVLRQTLRTDRDQPAFDKSTMDGVALRFDDWEQGRREFSVKGILAAGQDPKLSRRKEGTCVQIMTGAVVPAGYDCVIPIEHVTLRDGRAVVADVAVKRGDFIRYRASDYRRGTIVLREGCRLTAPRIATAASFGQSHLRVSRPLKVAVIATGDELVAISRKNIKPFEIRLSNSYALDCALTQTGLCRTQMFHFPDDRRKMLRGLERIVRSFDILVLSGGVSMGEFDYVPEVLKKLKVKVLVHKVSQKPGKPFWFGKGPAGKAVFALPGNPVSTQICAYRYVIPYLHKAAGLPYNKSFVVLSQDVNVKTNLSLFVPVAVISQNDGTLAAQPVSVGGSGDYASLSLADGFIELEANHSSFTKGFIAPFYSW